MKILQVLQRSQLRGAEIFACQLSEELMRLGHTVHIAIVFGPPGPLEKRFPHFTYHYLNGKSSRRFFDFQAYHQLDGIIRSQTFHLVQANAADTLKYTVLSRFIHRWKAKLVYRNANQMSLFFRNALSRGLTGWLLSKADQIVSVSENCRQDLVATFASRELPAVTIPIGAYASAVPRTSDRLGNVLLQVAGMVPEKNHSFMLRVFQVLLKSHPSLELWFVGDGPLRARLEEEAAMLGCRTQVEFLGVRSDVATLMQRSTMLVVPSTIEGLPGVILESFAEGLPVVAASVGGIPEVVRSGETGLCLREWEVPVFVQAIESLLSNQDERSRLAQQAKDLFIADYQMNKVADRFLKVYQHLCGDV